MQEILLEDQIRTQLHIQDPSGTVSPPVAAQPARQNRPRKPKQPKTKAPEATIEETINSLKNEIEYMPMKTPISILQELLSRRGEKKKISSVKKLLIFDNRNRNYSKLWAGADWRRCTWALLPLSSVFQRQGWWVFEWKCRKILCWRFPPFSSNGRRAKQEGSKTRCSEGSHR